MFPHTTALTCTCIVLHQSEKNNSLLIFTSLKPFLPRIFFISYDITYPITGRDITYPITGRDITYPITGRDITYPITGRALLLHVISYGKRKTIAQCK